MKFIHCADLHLDSKMDGFPSDKSKLRREEIVRTFERLADYANENGVKAVIIAGDMFDTSRITVKTREVVLHVFEKYQNVDFIYLSGNHDDVNFISSMNELPTNLKIIGKDWTSFEYGNVVVTGTILTSLNKKTAYDTLILDPEKVNIVTLHGQVAGYNSNELSEIINIPALKEKNIDYIALGHIHSYVKAKIDDRGVYSYSGCLDGRGFDELGDKGFVLIDVDGKNVQSEFVKFSSRTLHEVEFNVDGYQTWYSAMDMFLTRILDNYDRDCLIKVVLKGEHKPDFFIDKDQFAKRLNEKFFFAKVYDKTELKVSTEDYINDKSVRGEFVRSVWESDLSAQEKRRVILCGLNALKGEEF